MKISEIEITSETILLGVFGTKTYEYFKSKNISSWGDYIYALTPITPPNGYFSGVARYVYAALIKCDKVIFVLDEVHFPIDIKRSITCEELKLICQHEEFFKKTVFVKGDNVINFDKNLVS